MPHFLDENIAVLRRWAAITDEPLPEDWKQFASKNLQRAAEIDAKDPELAMLLSGKAPASLKADALSGKLSHVAPDQEAIAKEQREQQIAQIKAKIQSGEATLSERCWLDVNDPSAPKPQEQMPHFAGPLADAQRSNWIHNQMAAAGGRS